MTTRRDTVTPAAVLPGSGRFDSLGLRRRESIWGFIFISPWIVGFGLFLGLPMIASLYLSFTDFDPRYPDAIHFTGLANYQQMIADPLVWKSLSVTFQFVVLVVPTTLVVALGIAILVNSPKLFGRSIFRTLFYMPIQIPLIASTIIFLGVLNVQSGWIDMGLRAVGLPAPSWLTDEGWAHPALGLLGLWGIGNMMLIFIAGLQSVPTELYEAARVDGAGRFAQFRHVTLPMISTVLFYNLVISLIATFQYFLPAYVLTNGQGNPNNRLLFMSLDIYREGWGYYQMGYAAAIAWLMFLVVIAITLTLFWSSRFWVYDASGGR